MSNTPAKSKTNNRDTDQTVFIHDKDGQPGAQQNLKRQWKQHLKRDFVIRVGDMLCNNAHRAYL